MIYGSPLPDRCPNCQAPYTTEVSDPFATDSLYVQKTRQYACGWFIRTTPWGTFEEKEPCLRQGVVDMGVYPKPPKYPEPPFNLVQFDFVNLMGPPLSDTRRAEFCKRLESLLNEFSLEGMGGNTPDFILAEYLLACLENFGRSVGKRESWYGRGVGEISEAPGEEPK